VSLAGDKEKPGVRETSVTLLGLDNSRFSIIKFEIEEKLKAKDKSDGVSSKAVADLITSSSL
jgi:hypothetical protein